MSSTNPIVVLAAATIVASPALWLAMDGSLPPDVAMTRYLLATAICWVALTIVRTFAWPDVPRAEAAGEAAVTEIPTPDTASAPGHPISPDAA